MERGHQKLEFMNRDQLKFGVALGILFPSILFILIFLAMSGGSQLPDAWNAMVNEKILMKVIALCCVINLVLFYYFLNRSFYESTRGVIVGTLVYGIIGAILIFSAG
jgi:hypothetical protein